MTMIGFLLMLFKKKMDRKMYLEKSCWSFVKSEKNTSTLMMLMNGRMINTWCLHANLECITLRMVEK